MSEERIVSLIEQRRAALRFKNARVAASIAEELARAGIALEDGPKGTTWRRV